MNGFRCRPRPTHAERRARQEVASAGWLSRVFGAARDTLTPRRLWSFGPWLLAALMLACLVAPMGRFFARGWWYSSKPWNPLYFGSSLVAGFEARQADCVTDAGCLFASASGQYLRKDSPTFTPTTKMVFRVSWKPTDLVGSQALGSQYAGADNSWIIYQRGTSGRLSVVISGSGTDASNYYDVAVGNAFVAGTEYQVVVDYDGSRVNAERVRVYIDGALASGSVNGTIPTSLRVSSQPLAIGAYPTSAFANGIMQCCCISTGLTASQLTAAHTATIYNTAAEAQAAGWDVLCANLTESDGPRADTLGLNDLTAVNSPAYAQGVAEGLVQDQAPVKTWTARWNGEQFSTSVLANQPIWNENGGDPYLYMDGVDDTLLGSFAPTIADAKSPLVMACVANWISGPGATSYGFGAFNLGNGIAAGKYLAGMRLGFAAYFGATAAPWDTPTTGTPVPDLDGTLQLHIGMVHHQGTRIDIETTKDVGGVSTSGSTSDTSITGGVPPFTPNDARLAIGSRGSDNHNEMKVRLIVVACGPSVSSASVAALRTYLAGAAGMTL